MDTSAILAGGRPPVEAKQYFRKKAKARSIVPAEVPALLPTNSMQGLQMRQDAHVAAQRAIPGAKTSVEQDIVEQRRGEMIARRSAHTRVNFGAYDRQRENIEANLDAQMKVTASKNIIQHTGERMALQESLGRSHAELRGTQLHDFGVRVAQLSALIGSNAAVAKEAGARALTRQYRPGGYRMAKRFRANARLAINSGYQPTRQ